MLCLLVVVFGGGALLFVVWFDGIAWFCGFLWVWYNTVVVWVWWFGLVVVACGVVCFLPWLMVLLGYLVEPW